MNKNVLMASNAIYTGDNFHMYIFNIILSPSSILVSSMAILVRLT